MTFCYSLSGRFVSQNRCSRSAMASASIQDGIRLLMLSSFPEYVDASACVLQDSVHERLSSLQALYYPQFFIPHHDPPSIDD